MRGLAEGAARARLLAGGAIAGTLAALAALGGALGGSTPLAQAGPAQRNVVVIVTDDQRLDEMRVMLKTRRLIGRKGVRFRESFATFPLCCPARASYLTGQYGHNHGVRDNEYPAGGARRFLEVEAERLSAAVALAAAGYRTGYLGKYLNGYPSLYRQAGHVAPGWSRWGAALVPGQMYGWSQLVLGKAVSYGYAGPDYQTDVLGRQAASFIRQAARDGAPFFLTVMPLAPHVEGGSSRTHEHDPRPARRHRGITDSLPLRRSPAFNEVDVSDKPPPIRALPRLDRAGRQLVRKRQNDRLGSLLAVDDMVNKVVRSLRETGALANTLVIFTSDNGYMLGEHRIPLGKNHVYDPSSRVPLLMRGPGLPQGLKLDAPVGTIDLAPTIYHAVGVQPLLPPDGVSLLEVAANPGAYAGRELLIETTRAVAIRSPRYMYVEHDPDFGGGAGNTELYDLAMDPHQLSSRHLDPEYADVRARLAARLAQLRDCEGAECR